MTLRLHRATLRHYITLPEQSWHSQVSEGGVDGQISRLGGGQGQGHSWAGLGREAGGRKKRLILTASPTLPPKLLEFLDVLDDPVLGYLPPTVITILHTHLFSCAVDYRYPGWAGQGQGGGQAFLCKEPGPARL